MKRAIGILALGGMVAVRQAAAAEIPEPMELQATVTHGPQKPSAVPVLPGLQIGRNPFGGLMGVPAPGHGYRPVDGDSFACHNGSQSYNYIITSGTWWLQAGELPRLLMTLRTGSGAYAQPALLPDLGISGRLRVFVKTGSGAKWLDKFESIDAVLAPGAASWVCSDREVGVTIRLEANPLIDQFGFIATAQVQAEVAQEITLAWAFGRVGGDDDTVTVVGDYARITSPKFKYTEAYVACERAGRCSGQG